MADVVDLTLEHVYEEFFRNYPWRCPVSALSTPCRHFTPCQTKPLPRAPHPTAPRPQICTLDNGTDSASCAACGAPKPLDDGKGKDKAAAEGSDDGEMEVDMEEGLGDEVSGWGDLSSGCAEGGRRKAGFKIGQHRDSPSQPHRG